MKWQLAVKLALLLAGPLTEALRDGKLSREEALQLVDLLAGVLLRDSKS